VINFFAEQLARANESLIPILRALNVKRTLPSPCESRLVNSNAADPDPHAKQVEEKIRANPGSRPTDQ